MVLIANSCIPSVSIPLSGIEIWLIAFPLTSNLLTESYTHILQHASIVISSYERCWLTK